ncbi:hypothetical protein [Umezawaea sp. Da 62-37]|uniref:hypothetical protein n=1 Tax=Umezawaea sp. Da 62-37 TaxID=3075927 RepID=UPI0028F6F6AE|nr:hypothetical protein [Umezawaea sp. Da 62-37]WNV82030.1 hypothetical protein RM788_27860 [Umezawaea sp. Da 62-37]
MMWRQRVEEVGPWSPSARRSPASGGTALLGPAFVAAIPATSPRAPRWAARYGYLPVRVLVVANVLAGLVRYLSAKLGLVTGMSLPLGIPFALVPLTASRSVMGTAANRVGTTVAAGAVSAAVIVLDLALVYLTFA